MNMGSIKSRGKNSKSATWFGFRLNQTSAAILFIIALLGFLGSAIWLFFIITGIVNYASVSAAYNDLTGGLYGYYTSSAMSYYIMYLILDLIFIAIELYTISRTRRLMK